MEKYNNWELPIHGNYDLHRNYDLNEIYDHAHSELSLQQSKRDQLITVYLALCSFLIPFALGEELIEWQMKGLVFCAVGLIGILFSVITARYREYKEVYWLCCQTISLLFNFDVDKMDKTLVQGLFYQSLYKRGKGYLSKKGGKLVFDRKCYFRKSLFSSETLYFAVICFMASFMLALGLVLTIPTEGCWDILIGICGGLISFVLLSMVYFSVGHTVYGLLGIEQTEENKVLRNKHFNKVFSKAWFLHFCYEDPQESEKKEN